MKDAHVTDLPRGAPAADAEPVGVRVVQYSCRARRQSGTILSMLARTSRKRNRNTNLPEGTALADRPAR